MQMLTSLAFVSIITRALAGPEWHGPGHNKAHSRDILHPGTPQSVGMLAKPLWEMRKNISNYEEPADYLGFTYYEVNPIEPGESVIGSLPYSSCHTVSNTR